MKRLLLALLFGCGGSPLVIKAPVPACDPQPPPTRPEVTFLDTPEGGVALDREDSIDFLLYVSLLETVSRTTYVGCKR